METDKEPEPGGSRKSIMLNLDQKTNIFVADQTPTPTRLIKNCDEVGLFDDLRNVNPFDETFRRAVEGANPSVATAVLSDVIAEDSLHTPQVFPQLESNVEMLAKSLETPPITSSVTLDVPAVVEELLTEVDDFKTTSRQNSGSSTCFGFGKLQKYRNSVEKTSAATTTPTTPIAAHSTAHDHQQAVTLTPLQSTAPTTIQILQPQVYTLNIPLAVASNATNEASERHAPPPSAYTAHSSHAIPVQTVKPFILPKISASKTPTLAQHSASFVIPPSDSKPIEEFSAITSQPYTAQPSHANLTPTSQLPIKERLKAILNFHSKSREKCLKSPVKVIKSRSKRSALNCDSKYDDDCIERRRAASTRYRLKMRNEYKLLRQRNLELQAENEKLRQRVRQLEQQQVPVYQPLSDCNGNVVQPNVPVHLQIPPSTVHVLMSIPNLIVPANGRPVLMPAPYTNNSKN